MFDKYYKMAEKRSAIKLDTSIGLKELLRLYETVDGKTDFTDEEYIMLIKSIRDITKKYDMYLKQYKKILVDSALIDEAFYKLADKLGVYLTQIKFKQSKAVSEDWYTWFVYEDEYGKKKFYVKSNDVTTYIRNIRDFTRFMNNYY